MKAATWWRGGGDGGRGKVTLRQPTKEANYKEASYKEANYKEANYQRVDGSLRLKGSPIKEEPSENVASGGQATS
jgi:hypothetical protein